MKLLFFDDYRLGVIKGDTVVDVSRMVSDIPNMGPHNLISGLIEHFADYRGTLEMAAAAGKREPLGGRESSLRCPGRSISTAWR